MVNGYKYFSLLCLLKKIMIVKTVNFHRNSLARFFLIFLVDWAMFVLAFEKSEVSLLLVGFLGLEILPPLFIM